MKKNPIHDRACSVVQSVTNQICNLTASITGENINAYTFTWLTHTEVMC